jgi:hypothetical protein
VDGAVPWLSFFSFPKFSDFEKTVSFEVRVSLGTANQIDIGSDLRFGYVGEDQSNSTHWLRSYPQRLVRVLSAFRTAYFCYRSLQ